MNPFALGSPCLTLDGNEQNFVIRQKTFLDESVSYSFGQTLVVSRRGFKWSGWVLPPARNAGRGARYSRCAGISSRSAAVPRLWPQTSRHSLAGGRFPSEQQTDHRRFDRVCDSQTQKPCKIRFCSAYKAPQPTALPAISRAAFAPSTRRSSGNDTPFFAAVNSASIDRAISGGVRLPM